MDITFNDILNYIQTHGLTNNDINSMNEEINKYNETISKNTAKDKLYSHIKQLKTLYNTNEDFKNWCSWIKRIVLFDEYIENCTKKFHNVVFENDTNYYIPELTPKHWSTECNPYMNAYYETRIIYVKLEFEELIMDSEAFACFWENCFNTRLIPIFNDIENELRPVYAENIDSLSYGKYFKKEMNYFAYNKSELIKLFEESSNV